MAERRMFTGKITDADAFTSMPSSAQSLYFHLNMHADDDGFCNQINPCKGNANASEDDLKLLIAKRYIFYFDSGVIVIKHWRMHNLLRTDRQKETQFIEEKASLYLKENGSYTLDRKQGKRVFKSTKNDNDNQTTTNCQPSDNQMSPQYRIGKDSIGEDSIDNSSGNTATQTPLKFAIPSLKEVSSYCIERKNNINPQRFIDFYTSKGWKVGKNTMKDWKACIRTWENDDKKAAGLKTASASKYERAE